MSNREAPPLSASVAAPALRECHPNFRCPQPLFTIQSKNTSRTNPYDIAMYLRNRTSPFNCFREKGSIFPCPLSSSIHKLPQQQCRQTFCNDDFRPFLHLSDLAHLTHNFTPNSTNITSHTLNFNASPIRKAPKEHHRY